jgi:hypothetical protein
MAGTSEAGFGPQFIHQSASMTRSAPTLDAILRDASQISSFLAAHTDAFRDRFSSRAPFDAQSTECDLVDSLKRVEDSVLGFAQSTVRQIDKWNQSFVEIDSELNEIEALFQRVKSDTAASLVGTRPSGRAPPEVPPPSIPYPSAPVCNFPESPFDINVATLEGVGHQLAEIETRQASLPPLIRRIPPENPLPEFWRSSSDFFCPAMSAMLTVDDSAYATSFSAFYGFNPVPAMVLEQKKLIEQATRGGK